MTPRRPTLALVVALTATVGWAWLAAWYGTRIWLPRVASWSFFALGHSYEFLAPARLGIVLLAPFFVWVAARSLTDLPWSQRALAVLLRVTFVALLALAVAHLTRTTMSQRVCTVFLVDVSESVSDLAIEDARGAIATALRAKPADALVRVVTFARRPRVVPISEDAREAPALLRHASEADAGASSDLAAALQLAFGQFPSGYLRRAVFLTDGVQTDGDLWAEAARAREFSVRVSSIPYRRPPPGEVAVRYLEAPHAVRVGEPFVLRAKVYSTRAQPVRLTLKQGDALNGLDGERRVDLVAGENDVVFKSVVRVAGDVTYTAEVSEFADDQFVENNRYSVSLAVPGRPSVLYVEGHASSATYLAGALLAQNFEVDVRAAREIPSLSAELERYDFVILSDVPAEAVSLSQQDAIEHYVRDLGGGFLFAGGEAGFGLGGWAHTTIERVLPVRMEGETNRDEPQVAMVLVLDRSGSMSGVPIEMAKAAARATADALADDDLLEVITFDTAPTRVVRLTAAKHRTRIHGEIARIQAGGGTEIFPALDAAYQTLSTTRARRKHVVLLTDGQASHNGIQELVQSMTVEGITASAVGLGDEIDEPLLRTIAEGGGGRLYKAADPHSLPKIFTRETEMLRRSSAVEEYFQPKPVANADFLRGVDIASAPFLHGYVATKMKPPPAQELLQSDRGEPILARWHVGLGWSLAWTSDVKNAWAVEWLRWSGYGAFWGQLVREHMRQRTRQQFDLEASIDSATGHVKAVIDAVGTDDRFQNGLSAKLRMTGPQPSTETHDVPMRQSAPGRYEADFPLNRFGSFLLKASLERSVNDENGQPKNVAVATSFGHITNPYPREYLALLPDLAMLSAVAKGTQGTMDLDPARAFESAGESIQSRDDLWSRFVLGALFVYLFDLLVRRVRIFQRKETYKEAQQA
jgi:Mg-chelatase subunit ChlD